MGYFKELNDKRKNATHNVGSAIESGIRDLGTAFDENVTQPIANTVQGITELPTHIGAEAAKAGANVAGMATAPLNPMLKVDLPGAAGSIIPQVPGMGNASVDAAGRAALGMMGRGRTSTILTSSSGEDEGLLKTSRVVLGR